MFQSSENLAFLSETGVDRFRIQTLADQFDGNLFLVLVVGADRAVERPPSRRLPAFR